MFQAKYPLEKVFQPGIEVSDAQALTMRIIVLEKAGSLQTLTPREMAVLEGVVRRAVNKWFERRRVRQLQVKQIYSIRGCDPCKDSTSDWELMELLEVLELGDDDPCFDE